MLGVGGDELYNITAKKEPIHVFLKRTIMGINDNGSQNAVDVFKKAMGQFYFQMSIFMIH